MDGIRPRHALLASLVAMAAARPAAADGFDGQRFVPAEGAAGGFALERTLVVPHGGWGLGLFLHYADDPVVVRDSERGDILARPLAQALTMDLVASVGLFDVAELAVLLPVNLAYDGDATIVGGDVLAADEGLGDLRLTPKFRLLRGRSFGLGLAVPISLPTGDDAELRGAGDVTVEPKLLLSWWPGGRLSLAANAGYLLHTSAAGREGPGGDELAVGAGLRYRTPVADDGLVLSAELIAALSTSDGGPAFRDAPVEAIVGGIFEATPSWHLYVGGGLGLADGVGAPDFRAIFGIRYLSVGLSDRDGDGIVDDRDRAPDDPEDKDDFEDDDGAPDRDNDGDGIADEDDECPDAPEDPGARDRDGCPERGRAEFRKGKIRLLGKIRFKTNSAELLPSSDPILDDVAREMKRHPEIRRVRVEGHSDNVGDRGYNQRLSRERALSVRAALIRRGVSARRLDAAGYGESRPTATNRTERGRAKNRRVQFVIVK